MNFANIYSKLVTARIGYVHLSMLYINQLYKLEDVSEMEKLQVSTKNLPQMMLEIEQQFIKFTRFIHNPPDSNETKVQILSNYKATLNESIDIFNREYAKSAKIIFENKTHEETAAYETECSRIIGLLNEAYRMIKSILNSNQVNEFLHIKNVTPNQNIDFSHDDDNQKNIEKARNDALDAFNSGKITREQLVAIMNELNDETVKSSYIPMITKIY